MNRDDWYKWRARWQWALQQAAREIGKDQPLYRILGSVAWGRFEGEPGATDNKDNVVFGAGFLQGVRYAAMNAGRELKLPGTRHLERIHDRLRQEPPDA